MYNKHTCRQRKFTNSAFSLENEIELSPPVILTDLELAVIGATKSEFPNVSNKVCFFHLSQCVWRKIQGCGMATQYGTDEGFSLLLRHLTPLAFIPSAEIPEAFEYLKPHLPREANELVEWCESNYVLGRIRRQMRDDIVVRSQPLFLPTLRFVYDSIEIGIPRTQNIVEARHRRWKCVIGRSHIGAYAIIREFQREQQHIDNQVEGILRGESAPKRKKTTIDRENRIMNVVNDQVNRTLLNYVRGITHNLSM